MKREDVIQRIIEEKGVEAVPILILSLIHI